MRNKIQRVFSWIKTNIFHRSNSNRGHNNDNRRVLRIDCPLGCRIWEVNLRTSVIRPASLNPLKDKRIDNSIVNREINISPDCLYVAALNAQNARRKVVAKLQEKIRESRKNNQSTSN